MKILTRKIAIDQGAQGPKTWDAEARSVSAMIATESPVLRSDFVRGQYSEILLNKGMQIDGDRVPLQDSHMREKTDNTIGSVRNITVEKKGVSGTVFFSGAPEAESPAQKVAEGHLNSFSVGYVIEKAKFIEEGKKADIRGVKYTGPALVATRWRIKEVSLVAVPADPNAKARAEDIETITEEENMENESALEAAQAEAEKLKREIDELKSKTPDLDESAIRAEESQKERGRCTEIKNLVRELDLGDAFEQSAVEDGIDMAAVNERALEHIRNAAKTGDGIGHRGNIEVVDGGDEKTKFRAAASDSLCLRAGLEVAKPAPGADELRGFSLKELCREQLRISGRNTGGNPMQMVGRALSTTDFPLLMDGLMNNSMMQGFDTAEETWREVFNTGSVSDFKTYKETRLSESPDLTLLKEGQPYSYEELSELQESYSIGTYGGLMPITRQGIINDSLGGLTNIAMKHGEAAARKIGDVAWAALTANAAMGDSVALFHATHANYIASGAGAAVGQATMDAGAKAMMLQKDLAGKRRLSIMPRTYVGPASTMGAAEKFFKSTTWTDSNTPATDSAPASTQVNTWSGERLKRVYEPRLDTTSATAWYLFGQKGKTITVYFLDGQQTPYFESKEGWTVDGIEYKVRIDVGAKPMMWEGMYYNAGA